MERGLKIESEDLLPPWFLKSEGVMALVVSNGPPFLFLGWQPLPILLQSPFNCQLHSLA